MDIPIRVNLPDQNAVDPLGQALIDVVNADTGIRVRPGQEEAVDTASGAEIVGIYGWREQDRVIVVTGGNVYAVVDPSLGPSSLLLEGGTDALLLEDVSGVLLLEQVPTMSDVSGATSLVNDQQVVFANFGDHLMFCNGGAIFQLYPNQDQVSHGGHDYTCIRNCNGVEPGVTSGWASFWQDDGVGASYSAWDADTRYGSGTADELEDSLAPTAVDFIATIDSYLFALKSGDQTVYYSNVGEPWAWDSAQWVSAERQPDAATCMVALNGELVVGGDASIQTFVNDGVTPWIASSYGAIHSGVLAPHSFNTINGAIFFVDASRKLVMLSGYSTVSVNQTLDTYLNDLDYIEDAVGYYSVIDGIEYYILVMKTENKCVAVNLQNNTWSEWTNTETGDLLRWNVNGITTMPQWGLTLAGGTTGIVTIIDSSGSTDSGAEIGAAIRTPRIQTPKTVTVGRITVALSKVNKTISTGTAEISVRWRDDGRDWSSWRTAIVDSSKTDHIVTFNRCGAYSRDRQYEFDLSGLWPYAIYRAEQS